MNLRCQRDHHDGYVWYPPVIRLVKRALLSPGLPFWATGFWEHASVDRLGCFAVWPVHPECGYYSLPRQTAGAEQLLIFRFWCFFSCSHLLLIVLSAIVEASKEIKQDEKRHQPICFNRSCSCSSDRDSNFSTSCFRRSDSLDSAPDNEGRVFIAFFLASSEMWA